MEFTEADPSVVEALKARVNQEVMDDGIEQTGIGGFGNDDFWNSSYPVRVKPFREPTPAEVEAITRHFPVPDPFGDMKRRFLSFKRNAYLGKEERFQFLNKSQAPKFMVIACADSRFCPSTILGFQPGDAFVVRNMSNLVPPFENGPTETSAALEFAVNSLKVKYLFVIGHSDCESGRPRYPDFERDVASNSMRNLTTYPWVEERIRKGLLTIYGGYYNLVGCTFQTWTLKYQDAKSTGMHCKDCFRVRELVTWA